MPYDSPSVFNPGNYGPGNPFSKVLYGDYTHVPLPDIRPGENPYNNPNWMAISQINWQIDQAKALHDQTLARWKAAGLVDDAGNLINKAPSWAIKEDLNTGTKTIYYPDTGESKPYTGESDIPRSTYSTAQPVPRTAPIVVPTEGLPQPITVPEGGSVYFPHGTGTKPAVETPKPIVWQNTQSAQTPSVPQNIRIPDLSRPSSGPLAGNLFSTINGLQNRSTNRNPFSNPTQPMSGSFYYSRPKVTAGIY